MWWNKYMRLGYALCLAAGTQIAHAEISCPSIHAGKPLVNVRVYVGPIKNRGEQVPVPGAWQLYDPEITDPSLMTYDYRLRCQYEGTLEEVIVPLPHGTRVCEFDRSFPKVSCHP